MAIPDRYFPKRGQVVVCDFGTGFVAPEMVKVRPVVIVSPNATHGRRLCTIVPLSTTAPDSVRGWHIKLPGLKIPRWPVDPPAFNWAKCDMVSTVCFGRLTLPHTRDRDGKRQYHTTMLSGVELADVLLGLRLYLGASSPPAT